jgi:8-oxo-dGTP pyrophosphatase MutT (NUDIX family)
MATSRFPTFQYTSEEFVESAGAVLFHLSQQKICLVNLISRNEWLLAKGRRNCGESLQQAALREITEETGFHCKLLPVTMPTRAPPSFEISDTIDTPQTYAKITEPFMITIRNLDGAHNIKLISWYIAHVDETQIGSGVAEPEKFQVELFGYDETLKRLTFQEDRDVVQRALDIVVATYGA